MKVGKETLPAAKEERNGFSFAATGIYHQLALLG
jgi:hypothetical protein